MCYEFSVNGQLFQFIASNLGDAYSKARAIGSDIHFKRMA